ncbi:MAG: FIST C-terminal domain-containing protein [Myxococcota bacterium]
MHVLEEARGGPVGAEDLVLLFPDALEGVALEERLATLQPRLQGALFAGAAAAGPGSAPARAWVGETAEAGGTLGVIVPGGAAGGRRLGAAGATRFASPWLRIGQCRSRWVDELEGEPALDWVRRQLGLEAQEAVEPHLDRLMVRLRSTPAEADAADETDEGDTDYLERYVIGLDDERGSISIPTDLERGAQLAFALPDADRARANLRAAAGALPPSPVVLQFACRARDASLHGDADLEGAWVQHAVGDRAAVGTLAPFQIGPSADGRPRQLVHTTLLAALGRG